MDFLYPAVERTHDSSWVDKDQLVRIADRRPPMSRHSIGIPSPDRTTSRTKHNRKIACLCERADAADPRCNFPHSAQLGARDKRFKRGSQAVASLRVDAI